MKKIIEKNIRMIIILISVILIYIVFEKLNTEGIGVFDNNLTEIIHLNRVNYLTKFWILYTDIVGIYIPILISLMCICLYKKNVLNIFIPINLVIVTIANQILKILIARQRPENALINETGYSFPSGHSMVAFAFYGLLIYYVYEYVKNKNMKVFLTILLSTLIISVGYSRIYLGVHYPSDVIAGFLLSLAYLPLFTKIIKEDLKYLERRKKI